MQGEDRYSVDALMARVPKDHEQLALELRREIRAARDTEDEDDHRN